MKCHKDKKTLFIFVAHPCIYMKKIIIASDSFKGSVSSLEVADACEKGIRQVYPDCEVVKLPIADGGEGTIEALVTATKGRYIRCLVHDPLMRPVKAVYGVLGDERTAVIEMATASGLPLVEPELRNPLKTTTYGTGELIRDALSRGFREFIIGIGGSATNDAGIGMLQALDMRFTTSATAPDLDDCSERTLYSKGSVYGGEILTQIIGIDSSNMPTELQDCRFTIACDVDNPFSGPQGAAYIFAPQKGANAEMVKQLDEGMKHFARLIAETTGKNIDTIPGAGAAGGLGGAFLAFLPATLRPGIATILDALHFDHHLQGADLVITGEGKLDAQTLRGKAPWGVLQVAQKLKVPVIAISGVIENSQSLLDAGFAGVYPIHEEGLPIEQALDKELTQCDIQKSITWYLQHQSNLPQGCGSIGVNR